MATPSVAKYFVQVDSIEQFGEACAFAAQHGLACLPLGDGSNSVFADAVDALVMHVQLKGIELIFEDHDSVLLTVQAGENWHELVQYCVEHSWYGLENLALIPGQVGAAPIQNIGAYGAELSDTCVEVQYFDLRSGELVLLSADECQFGYRDSIFKGALKGKAIISAVTLKLKKCAQLKLDYPDLKGKFEQQKNSTKASDLEALFQAVCGLRAAKLPDPLLIPNAGSFFKNPLVSADKLEQLQQRFSDIVYFKKGAQIKLAAAWLIDQAGWKQKNLNGVVVHQSQALVITNPECRSATDVLGFAAQIQADIRSKYGVDLEIEPNVFGV